MRAILTYHSIDTSGSPISCHPEAFARHVEWFASGRVRVTTIDELMQLPASTDAVALTFDDGFVNFQDEAAPRLLDRGFAVTLFVVAGLAGKTNAWDAGPGRTTPELPLLDWPALARLQEQGVTLGAHSLSHRSLTRLTAAELEDEVCGCADRIQAEAGLRPSIFAYPYGHWDAVSSAAVARTFRWGCTTDLGPLQDPAEPSTLPRLDMYYFGHPRSLDGWGTRAFASRIALRRAARRARTIVQSFRGAR